MTVRFTILFLLLGSNLSSWAQEKHAPWRAVDSWKQAQGLPQNSIYQILQTQDGYIWIGTKGGVGSF